MRERINMKSKMLGALALFALIGALFVMQSAETDSTPRADAATGTIHALNVGTCLATDADIFEGEGCMLKGDGSDATGNIKWEVRKEVEDASTLYATYAYDPKTASDEPRVILEDSDLIKISIADSDRDKRSGVLIRGASFGGTLNDDMTADLGEVIRDDLEDDGLDFPSSPDPNNAEDSDIEFSSEDSDGQGIELYIGPESDKGASRIDSSGNFTLNFTRTGTYGSSFAPADFKVDSGAVVRFYGCVTGDQGSCSTSEVLDQLTVDEDASNGEAGNNVAPWLAVNASVPSRSDIVIQAIYYRTSDMEDLVGGQTYRYCSDGTSPSEGDSGWTCGTNGAAAMMNASGMDVVFTDDEMEDNDALLVRASSDGDQESVNLFLSETSIFSGRYEGYLQLTDANGDGSTADMDDSETLDVDETKRTDWGLKVADGSATDPAVLGVESGPVTIEYRDSDGRTRTLRIEIDRQAPAIQVESPASGTSSDDHTPDFNGTIEDNESGLVEDSFRLVIDNEVDGTTADYALDIEAGNVGTSEDDGLAYSEQFTGFDMIPTGFGTVMAADLYDLGREACGDEDICHITSDVHDEGANTATFSDSIRLNLQDSDGDAETRDEEYDVDFQAFALDRAGNIGFSDSDPASPRFINNLGEKKDKREAPNVFGYYSAHIITLDEKDPVIAPDMTATGYYGLNSDGDPMNDRSAVMIAFEGSIAPASVSTDTFSVELDGGDEATIVDVDVEKNYVFLKLDDELASDATPEISIATGEKVEDMAGNELFSNELDPIEAKDGINPTLTLTLSGGSGSGTGDEGPDALTNERMTVHIASDEPLQGSPRIVVVCESLEWNTDSNGSTTKHDIDDFIANRSGAFGSEPSETPARTNQDDGSDFYDYTCGYDADNDKFDDNFGLTKVSALSRPGDNWEFTWTNTDAEDRMLQDGTLTAVAFARDRSSFKDSDDDTLNNWGSGSAEFTLDTELDSPIDSGDLQPAPDGTSKEVRPFVLIEFNDKRTVSLDSVELDDVEVADQFEQPDTNRFLYWPMSLSQGDHEVEVEASDAAGNEVSFSYEFEVAERGDFVIGLNAGWNAISVPADPVDTAIGSVFTDPEVTTVIGWDTQGWRIAVRRDGVWESNEQYGTLNEIRAKYGYWVKSDGFVRQPVELKGGTSRDAGGTPILISIPTEPGWNFVGVIDQDGDQTEDHFGIDLQDSSDRPVTALEYLGSNYVRAYTWDATFSRFDVVRPDSGMTIGDGIWVYYPEGTGIAP